MPQPKAVANQPMIRVSGINRPAQVSLRPWDFDLGNPGMGSTQYLVFGSSAGEASVNVKLSENANRRRENWLTTSCPLSPACLCTYSTVWSCVYCTLSALSPGQSSPLRRYVLFECRVVIVVMELKVECLGEQDGAFFLSTINSI
jgi:hypothetical protein